jgi:ribulose-phosphate 3-epimerase
LSKIQLAPSLLNADFAELGAAIQYVEGIADLLHLDVMDGRFVPNITFGPLVVRAVRRVTALPLDAHLMIEEPERYVEDFAKAGADWISFHLEAAADPIAVLDQIRALGLKAGMAISPATPASELTPYLEALDFALVMTVVPGFGGQSLIEDCLSKIGEIKEAAANRGRAIPVQVDGGIKTANLPEVLRAGADIVVVGASIFCQPDVRAAAAGIRGLLDSQESSLL